MEAVKIKKKSSEIKSNNQIDNIHATKIFISNLIEKIRTQKDEKTLKEIAQELRDETKRKISDDLFTSIIEKINLLSDKYRNAKSEEFSDAVTKAIDDLRKNSSEPVSIFSPSINKLLEPKERVKLMSDKDVIKKVQAMLAQALQDVPESDGNRALRHVVKKAVSMLNQQLQQSPPLQAEASNLAPSTFPDTPPLLWSNRRNFRLEDITDPFLKAKLEANQELEQQIRKLKPADGGLTFLDIVYGAYIQAGFGKKELRTTDKTLFDICEKSSNFGQYLPNKKMQIDKKILAQEFTDDGEKKRAYMVLKKREQRARQLT